MVDCSAREVFGHIESVKILVILNSTGYMLTSSGFDAFIHLRYILWIPLKRSVILLEVSNFDRLFLQLGFSEVFCRINDI